MSPVVPASGVGSTAVGPAGLPAKALPANPVRLYADGEDPCVCRLQILSLDQVGLLFKLCELLANHSIDIVSADVSTEDGVTDNRFELHTSRPSDFNDAGEWCKELEEFLARNHASGGSALEGSLVAVSKRLSVNPDLLSVVSFHEITDHDGPESELRYHLELAGINQAGLLTYTALVLYRSGFSVVNGTISTVEGHVSDTFLLSAGSNEAESLLRSYLDVPFAGRRKDNVPLPFQVSPSDCNLEELMRLWGKPRAGSISSSTGSFCGEEDGEGGARTGFPSELEDCEEPTGVPGHVKRLGEVSRVCRSGSTDSGGIPGGTAGSSPRWRRDARRMSVHFANGDVYTGNCVLFEGGEKRHGLGTYVYSPGTHETYKQYRGQWREDKKNGYGVLFYRNGGVYVGQWENNQKSGLGVLLDNTGISEVAEMPSFRYEGQWHEDEPHGLGAEETDTSCYFGHFSRGKRQGRGVRMNLVKMGSSNCEVVDSDGRCSPLLDALEAELARLARPARSSFPPQRHDMQDNGPSTFHAANSQDAEAAFDLPPNSSLPSNSCSPPRTGRRVSAPMLIPSAPSPTDGTPWAAHTAARTAAGTAHGSESGSGSSEKNSGDTRSPMSARMQNLPTRMDVTTPSEGQATPLPLGGCSMKARTPQGASLPRVDFDPPLETQATPLLRGGSLSGNTAASNVPGIAPASRHPIAAPSAGMGATTGGAVGSTHSAWTERTAGPRLASPRHEGRTRSGSNSSHAGGSGSGGSVVFSLWEENNLLSPPDTTLDRPIPEEAPNGCTSGSHAKCASDGFDLTSLPALARPTGGRKGSVDDSCEDRQSSKLVKANLSEPWAPVASRGKTVPEVGRAATDEAAPVGNLGRSATVAEGAPMGSVLTEKPFGKKDSRTPHVRATPLLWSEDELAAFISCLGVSTEVCKRVQQRKLKGVANLLEMTNSELSREFGLTSPVERLVVRQSLKRLLDADRWENCVRGHKVGDIIGDSVLSKFIVPLEELTLVSKISQGGYGTVYRGVLEPSTERGNLQAHRSHLVAVKEMRGERRVRLYELLKEACVMASLKHPNICTFIGVCANAAAKKHYIISELMDCSLFDLIHQPYKLRWHGELTVSLVVNLSKAICSGIVYLHSRSLVHADLKSSNILIDYSTSWQLIPRICDFGHAAVRTFPTPHHRCGTPHWAGPEVLRSEALGPAADIYSFGVIMWEMFTQKLPHKGLSFGQVLASVGWAGWTPDLSLLPDIPQELRRLLKECLSFSPADRPASKDVQRRLRRIPKQARLKALRMLAAFLS